VTFQNSHSLQTLSEEQLKYVAKMSEDDDYFKSGILKPFLRTRVSDTEGNRAVREVCLFFMQVCIIFFLLDYLQCCIFSRHWYYRVEQKCCLLTEELCMHTRLLKLYCPGVLVLTSQCLLVILSYTIAVLL